MYAMAMRMDKPPGVEVSLQEVRGLMASRKIINAVSSGEAQWDVAGLMTKDAGGVQHVQCHKEVVAGIGDRASGLRGT